MAVWTQSNGPLETASTGKSLRRHQPLRWRRLTDLHGDIVAAASLSETETKLLSAGDASEFGKTAR